VPRPLGERFMRLRGNPQLSAVLSCLTRTQNDMVLFPFLRVLCGLCRVLLYVETGKEVNVQERICVLKTWLEQGVLGRSDDVSLNIYAVKVCEISSSHGGIILHGSISQKTTLNIRVKVCFVK
jgi:hypothetical protein